MFRAVSAIVESSWSDAREADPSTASSAGCPVDLHRAGIAVRMLDPSGALVKHWNRSPTWSTQTPTSIAPEGRGASWGSDGHGQLTHR